MRLIARIVPADSRQPRIDHISNTRNRNRRFRNIRRHHNAPISLLVKHFLLIARCQPPKQWQNFCKAKLSPLQTPARLMDILLRGHKNQNITSSRINHHIHCGHRRIDIRLYITSSGEIFQRPVLHIHRIHPPGHFNNGRIVKRL